MIDDIITINGTNLLVLDEINGNPFVIALGLDIKVKFDSHSNNYDGSALEKSANDWLAKSNIPVIKRSLDLTTGDGCHDYGCKEEKIAPLTLFEYRKYWSTINGNIISDFWLATGSSTPSYNYGQSHLVYCISLSGMPHSFSHNQISTLAPAFIIDKAKLDIVNGDLLRNVTTKALFAELARRLSK